MSDATAGQTMGVLIVGGGIGGLTAALVFGQKGFTSAGAAATISGAAWVRIGGPGVCWGLTDD
jgi:hypothetical protein